MPVALSDMTPGSPTTPLDPSASGTPNASPSTSWESTELRTRMAGTLRESDQGSAQLLAGWAHRRRNLGGVLFVDLRDRSGVVQLSFGPDWTEPESLERSQRVGLEDVIRVEGVIEPRPGDAKNPDMPTGAVELRVRRLEILNPARTPEIPVYRGPEDELPSENLRLRHRNLDLRRPELQQNLILRHHLVLAVRNYLSELGFLEVETPILTKPTPEGARDYLVPSRVHPGEFYALPQSPQIYKQLLMTAGFDRYFQIARCFRDEDLRADRQPEFTQIDLEASFVGVEDLITWIEGLAVELAQVARIEAVPPFVRMTWAEAMDRYGSDRPDLRWALAIDDWSDALGTADASLLRDAVAAGGRIRGFRVAGGATLSRKQVEAVEAVAKAAGAPGLLWAKRTADGGSGPLSRWMEEAHWGAVGAAEGDLLLVAVGPDRMTSPVLSAVRGAVIEAMDIPRVRDHAWAWVLDFPLFEEEGGAIWANHHPFVLPHPDDLDRLDSDPLSVRGLAYDLVYNGSELGSGSLRNHDAELQRRILRILGLTDDEIEAKFGFLLEALGSGAPPHGGMALGMDRIVKDFLGVRSLRDVIAFPKTTAARALFEGAPSPVSDADLNDLRLRVERSPVGPESTS